MPPRAKVGTTDAEMEYVVIVPHVPFTIVNRCRESTNARPPTAPPDAAGP